MTRSRPLLVAVLCAALPACLTVDFIDGDGKGGGGAPGGGGSGGEAVGAGGTGGDCPTTCTEDRRCGDDGCDGLCNGVDITSPLAVELPVVLNYFEVWQETQSAFVAADSNVLYRIDLCTGEVMASLEFEEKGPIRGVELSGETLFVASGLPSLLLPSTQIHRLDPRTLEPLGAATDIADMALWDATLGTSGLWVNHDFLEGETGADGPALVKTDGTYCRAPLPSSARARRGSAAFGDDLIVAMGLASGEPPTTMWYAMKLECTDCTCGEVVPSNALASGFQPYAIASSDDRYALVGYSSDASGIQAGTIAELDPSTMIDSAPRSLDPHPAGSSRFVDGFVHGAIFGDALYAVGVQGESAPLAGDGAAWIARFDLAQPDGDASQATVPGGTQALRVFADETGVYVSGRRDVGPAAHGGAESIEGFFVRCTHDLQCPRVGPELPTVFCNGEPCEDGEACCWDNSAPAVHQCSVGGVCPDQYAVLACNGPDDCGGDECCLVGVDPTYSIAQCKPECGLLEKELCFGYPGACDVGGCGPLNGAGDGWYYCN